MSNDIFIKRKAFFFFCIFLSSFVLLYFWHSTNPIAAGRGERGRGTIYNKQTIDSNPTEYAPTSIVFVWNGFNSCFPPYCLQRYYPGLVGKEFCSATDLLAKADTFRRDLIKIKKSGMPFNRRQTKPDWHEERREYSKRENITLENILQAENSEYTCVHHLGCDDSRFWW